MGHGHDFKWTGSDYKTASAASYCELSRITDSVAWRKPYFKIGEYVKSVS
jgi:hypothetical protein